MRAPLAVLATLLLAPLALGQGHTHETGDGMAMVLHDGPDDGRAVVGGRTHFGFALIGPDGAPVVHRNARIDVFLGGEQVFGTEDAHEYDGLMSLDVTFTKPGRYQVVASSDKMVVGIFEGEAVAAPLRETRIEHDAAAGTLALYDEAGLVEHADLDVELRRAGDERLVQRFHLHVHDAPAAFSLAGPPGGYVLRVVGYEAFPTGRDGDIATATGEFPVTLGPVPTPAAPAVPAVPGVLRPTGASATSGGFALHGTFDPQNQVGVGQPIRLAGLLVNETGMPVAHVDYAFQVKGPTGVLFSSASLHEYDGVFEHVLVPDAPGAYDATLTATLDGAELAIPYQFQVVPPAAPIAGAGVGTVSIAGLDEVVAGAATELTFRIAGPQGPVQHSEVDVALYHDGEAPVYAFKLHTHESGETKALVVFPHGGDWSIRVDPIPTLPQAVVFEGPGGPRAPLVFAVSVPEADATGALPGAVEGEAAARAVPLGAAFVLIAAALVGMMLPRRE